MNEATEQVADGIWSNMPLKEKLEVLEKSGYDLSSPDPDIPKELEE